MVSMTKSTKGRFYAAPEFMVLEAESASRVGDSESIRT
jgi:hypothetical protein